MVGIGFDAHRFTKKRKLILGGIKIPYKFGLAGHSDADVLVHAIVDALLGGAGLKDIGHYFPDTANKWRNISSLEILRGACALLKKRKITIVNIDAVIIAQEPKIAQYSERMKAKICPILGIKREFLSIKGKTTEGMGFTGRKQGIAALAVCQLRIR